MGFSKQNGIVVVDKPTGVTSHDVVARVRRKLGVRDVGHAGTLDPMATGVLVVLVGEATKLARWLAASDKAYEATIALGVTTDTLDADGQVTASSPVPKNLREALEKAIEIESKRESQVPPEFSALHVGGTRAHTLARRGNAPIMPARDIAVRSITLVSGNDPNAIRVNLDVAKGYYVRSFARDLAEHIGTVGHLTALRRVRAGAFTIDEAIPIDTLTPETLSAPKDAVRRALPIANLTEKGAADARHGRVVALSDLDAHAEGPHAWIDPDGALVAVGSIDGQAARVLRGFSA